MPQPTERDITVVQDKLAELYASLSPAQQEVLDTLMAAGLSSFDANDDTGGFIMTVSVPEAEAHMRTRMAELQEDWRRANMSADVAGAPKARGEMRWNLKPLIAWWQRSTAQPA